MVAKPTDAGVGDVEVHTLGVAPYDQTTAAELTVTAPDGTATVVAATPDDDTPEEGTQTWSSEPVTYTAPGRWVLTWHVTGTGAGAETVEVWVVASPVAGGPTWTPGRSRVAAYLPGRTLPRDAETMLGTFTSATTPTGVQVDRLIADAVAWLKLRTGQVHPLFHEAAATVAAMRAAAAVERGFPAQSEEQSLARARDLEEQAAAMLDVLVRANQTPDTQGQALMPLWSFPTPVSWGDETFI